MHRNEIGKVRYMHKRFERNLQKCGPKMGDSEEDVLTVVGQKER